MARGHPDRLEQIAWFNRLRLFAAAGVAMVTGGAHLLGVLADAGPLYVLAGVTLLVDLAYVARFKRLQVADARTLRGHVDLQIAIDLVLLSAMLHFSGGITNPFVLFYLFHTFIASLLRSSRAALVVSTIATVCIAALAFLEWTRVIQHRPIRAGFMDLESASATAVTAVVLALGVTQYITVYFLANVLRRLTRREQELAGVRQQLGRSEKLAAIGALAAGVAHEINNPIGVIKNKVEILRHRIDDGDTQDALRRELDVVDRHIQRIGNVTQGLLTFAKETPFSLKPVAVNALAREAAELVQAPFRGAEIELALAFDARDPRVMGSANHLLQVLINILLNARDASPPSSTVFLSTKMEEGEVALVIRDQGTGIPADLLPKIFDPFFTTKDVDKGTGLGLAISHGIIERHGGHIDVDTVVGEGTTFAVVLPPERS